MSPVIRGLSDLNNTSGNNDNGHNTSSYTGGEKSGIAVENPGGSDNNDRIPKNAFKITLYKNGFILDEGEFRDISIPENQEFVNDIRKSVAPEELRKRSLSNGTVHIALDDRSSEVYVPPKKAMEVFSGSGNSLSQVKGSGYDVNINSDFNFSIDNSKPTTNIQLRFHNGQKKVVTLNHTNTIGDLHCIFMEYAPVDGEYRLIYGFPPKEISMDPNTSLKDAGLLQETISQKLI
ncbi:hypothetical protein FG386_001271 [Cryptosporidium ryanae]|uniref:uncharacterized protein n=1 Tax=Cryptosporidium ryanae TaxID=515981 RepID=UPI00351A360D|nr:hypothetical protein FG386_001271 [Cryptosporidium ryanae]